MAIVVINILESIYCFSIVPWKTLVILAQVIYILKVEAKI